MCKKCGQEAKGHDYCLPCELEAVYQHGKAHAEARAETQNTAK
jgi:hypothetical protein